MSRRAAVYRTLRGGLNLSDYAAMDASQSPELKNLWWSEGMLRSRPGQVLLTAGTEQGVAAFGEDFHGWGFFHIGETVCCADLSKSAPVYRALYEGVGREAGTFFRYGEYLYYKTYGHFVRIACGGGDVPFTAAAVEPYVPTVVMNADPQSGAGDLYQQENRLTGKRRVRFNPDGETLCYRLPLQDIQRVESAAVNGETVSFTADLAAGTLTFETAPEGEPNSVEVVFEKENPDAYRAVMSCRRAAVWGTEQQVCLMLSGGDEKNAFFWNGNGTAGMEEGYFPMACYNRCGDGGETVTGFGRQYGEMMLLKERSIWRLEASLEEVDGKSALSLTCAAVSPCIGCDLPGSIALIENNLVFCNRRLGVWAVLSSSAAYENNVRLLSANVHGGALRPGLLAALEKEDAVTAFDDGRRYYLAVGEQVYLWDYAISTHEKPAWFYFTGFSAAAFLRRGQEVFLLGRDGSLVALRDTYSDFGAPIEKVCRFPTTDMGGYERRKDVTDVILALRCETDSEIGVEYETDFGLWREAADIPVYSHRLVPRDLAHRCLGPRPFAHVVHRRCAAKDVHHFSLRLTNALPGQDLAVLGVELRWRYKRKER